jgi:prepilin-type processing-associated H-X9-DG protein
LRCQFSIDPKKKMPGKQTQFLHSSRSPATKRAFSRIDLLAVILVVAVLGVRAGMTRSGETKRIAECAHNLSALGKAMHRYADEHVNALPAAGMDLGGAQSSWDTTLFAELEPGLAKSDSDELLEEVPKFYVCPSDDTRHTGLPRSYSMGGNDMSPEQWPPGRDSATGVGLWWDKRTVLTLLDEDALEKPDSLPAVSLSDVPAPGDTVLLTEFIGGDNLLRGNRMTSVLGTSQQRQNFKDGGARFHGGKFNYLMVDGHVEPLSPLQTGSFDGTAGIWSLKKGN